MGAVPKNKITSVERGKRRAGNRPKLKRDVHVAKIPLHKRGLMASFSKLFSSKKSQNKKTATK